MVLSGTEMYDLKGNQVIIEKVKEDLIYAVIIQVVEIRYNDNKCLDKQITKKSEIFNFNELGIRLFFNKDDLIKHKRLQVEDKRYFNNYDNIYAYFSPKFNSKVIEIKEDKPIGSILSTDLKEKIINGYYSYNENIIQEKAFHLKNKGCFGRIDLDTEFYRTNYEKYYKEHYYDKVYISKGQYQTDGDIHIVNWRSPVASMFYDNENTRLTRKSYLDIVNETRPYINYLDKTVELELGNPLNVYNFELMLKRTYSFNPLKYKNTYIASDDFYLEGSTDSFLLDVLEENRANHKMTDIIKSIQSSQNKMIRHAVNNNMIVQGCAGSGKTMILLHRISYLLFNVLLPVPSQVKIITPNENFSEFIKDLVNSLELGAIERTTMLNYYLLLIKRYQKILSTYLVGEVVNKKEIGFNKEALGYVLDIGDNFIESYNNIYEKEIRLDEELFKNIDLKYMKEINKFCENIAEDVLFEIANRIGLEYDKSILYGTKDYFDNLYNLCFKDIISANEKTIINIKKLQDSIDKNNFKNKVFENLLEDVKVIESYATVIKEIGFSENNNFEHLSSTNEILKDLNKTFTHKNIHLNSIKIEYQKNASDFKNEIKILKLKEKSIPFNQIYYIKTINDKINSKVLELNSSASKYENEHNIIKAELKNINNEFNNLIINEFPDIEKQSSQEDYLVQTNKFLNEIRNSSNVPNDKIKEVRKQLIDKINLIIRDLKIIKFESNSYNNNNYLYATKQLIELKNILGNFLYRFEDIQIEGISKCNELINKLLEIIKEDSNNLSNQQQKLSKILLTDAERTQLTKSYDKLQMRKMLVINIYEKIRNEIRLNLNITFDKKVISKIEVLIFLYLYYLHCGELSEKDSFLFIDEGQDYSIMEYELLKLVNGDKCIFNIFGDVKQLLNSATGLDNWDLLKELIISDYYELQENYRNTVEITNFVNRKFNYKLNPIGVHGPDVQYIQLSQMPDIIKAEMKNDMENRIAIIVHKKESKKINDKYKGRISYYSVKEVKGLEFDIAFVITDGMNTNEEYISYTRALNKLYLI